MTMISQLSFAFVLAWLLLYHAECVRQNGFDGPYTIAFVSITTDDLQTSLKFYTQVLGGMHATELGFHFHGDNHYELIFQKELQEAREQGVDPAELGVPDIRDSGSYEIRGEFVVFDNGLIQLVQFSPRSGSGPAFMAHETRTSPAYIAAPHICFWVQDEVDFNHYIAQLEARASSLGLNEVKVNRPVEVHSDAEREAVPESQLGITFNQGVFTGLSFAYFKGPRGEQLELYRIRNETRDYLGRDMCQRGAVSTAFVSDYSDNRWKMEVGVTAKLFGLFQFGTRTDNLWRSVDFYVDVLRANLVRRPLQATNVRGDDVENMLFQKELLDSASWQVPPEDIGIANISSSGDMRLDHRFSLFDNYVVETLLYTDGLDLGDPVFAPRYNHSSLAYVNEMDVSLMLRDSLDLPAYLDDLEANLAANGFNNVKINRIPGQGRGHLTFTQGPLKDLSYSMVHGPAGEHVSIVQFKGEAREKLKRALLQYGAVSTSFPETNPWTTGRMDAFCNQYNDDNALVGR